MFRKYVLVIAAVVAIAMTHAQAFGPKGHKTVGAIADQRIASKPVAAKVNALLDGLTLEEAAVLADDIKSWDKTPPNQPHSFHVHGHPVIDQDLQKFWYKHSKRTEPDYHRNYHFTDVPVGGNSKYAAGTTGRGKYDLVQMINVCIKVLKTNTTDDEFAITPRVAVILLAHYAGDIAQPLHVGSQYFDAQGNPSNPDAGGQALSDTGGNSLTLVLKSENERGFGNTSLNLHGWWDEESVDTAYDIIKTEIVTSNSAPSGPITDATVIKFLGLNEPTDWKMPSDLPIEKYSEKWADEILPLANEAHTRLNYKNIVPHGTSVVGFAFEKDPEPDNKSYADWGGKIVRVSIHKAGWRLADLLEKALQ